ncbi:MAG: flavodoxin domain-containing protein [Desulfobacterales bacterium]
MAKAVICYTSRTGNTEKMANYIAEGLRMKGTEVDLKKISEIKDESQIDGYDIYVFGCPTYHRDLTANMKTFLFLAQNLNLVGKIGGAFGPYTHSGESAPMIYDTMQFVYKMDTTDLGALSLKDAVVETDEGTSACQDYGKALAEKIK